MLDSPLKWRRTENQGLLVRSGSVSDIDELTDDSGESLYTSCVNDHQKGQQLSSITDPYIPVSSMKRTSTPTENLLQPTEVNCSPQEKTSLIYTNEKPFEQDLNRNFSNSCGCALNLDPHNKPTTPSVCADPSLGRIIRSLKIHLAEFQNSSNDSWTMREANFCLRTLRELLDMVEKMDCFNQKYHSFVMNFDRHVLEILHLNVESLLLSMRAYVRCASSLQTSQHSGGIALYPEELIQMMRVLIEQSIRAVNTAWVTFLQSTHSQIDEFSAGQHPQASSPIQKRLGCENQLKEGKQAESLSAKDTVCSPEESQEIETPCEEMQTGESKKGVDPMCECRGDVEHLAAGLSSPSHTVSCSTCGQESGKPESDQCILKATNSSNSLQKMGDKPSGQPLFDLRECFVPLEKINASSLPRNANNQKLFDMDILSDHSTSMCDSSPIVQNYTFSGQRHVTERNPLKQHTKAVSSERNKRKLNISKPISNHKGSDVLKSLKPSVTRFDISPGHKSKTDIRKPLNRCEEDGPCSGASPQVLCTERGTQTPSRLQAHKTSGTSVDNRSRVPRVQSGSGGKDSDKERRPRSSTCSLDDHEKRTKKTPGSSKSQLNESSSGYKDSKKSKKKLFPDLKDDANFSSKKEERLKDPLGLTTFVSSVKSYKCSPTAVHVSLQVSCVERTVLARKLSYKATKQLEKKKAKDRSRKRALQTKRIEKSRTGSTCQSSLEEKNSSTPRKRLKSADDALIMKNYYDSEVNAKSRQKSLVTERDGNNNAMPNNLSKVNQLHSEQVKFHSLFVDNSFVPADTRNLQGRTSGSSRNSKGDNSQVRTRCIMLEDEEHFFLNQQAELTAKIKRMRKKKARGVDPGSITPNTSKGKTDNEVRIAPKLTDSNNNFVP